MRDVLVVDDGSDRRWQWCLCTDCGRMGIECTGLDFAALEDDASGALLCRACFDAEQWARALEEHDNDALRAELEAARTEEQQRRALRFHARREEEQRRRRMRVFFGELTECAGPLIAKASP